MITAPRCSYLEEGNRPVYRTVFLIALLYLLILLGCSDGTKEELFAKGEKMVKDDNVRGAIVMFVNALEKDPNYLEARLELAKAYSSIGKLDSAQKEFRKARLLNPSSTDTRIQLAKVYIQQEHPDEALEEVKDLISESSKNSEAFQVAGYAHALKNEPDLAKKYFLKSLSLDKANVSAAVGLAKIHIKAGLWEKAREQVQEILSREPENRAALLTFVDIESHSANWAAAEGALDKILTVNPDDLEILTRKGYLYVKIQDFTKANSLADDVIKRFPRGPLGFQLKGMAQYHLGNYDEALIALQRSNSIRPNVMTYYYLGLTQYAKGDLEQSLGSLYKALDINPGLNQARVLAAAILTRQNRQDDAIGEVQRVLSRDEDNAAAHNLLGSLYMSKGMYEEGMAELNAALEIDPNMADAHVKRGLLNLRLGNAGAGVESLATAVSIDPDVLNSHMLLASYYKKMGKYDEARATLKKGLNGTKADAIILNLLADIDIQQNHMSEAISKLKEALNVNPDLASSYFNLASVYFTEGDRDSAVKILKELAENAPDNANAHITIGSILEFEGKQEEAQVHFRRGAETRTVQGYLALAKFELRRNEVSSALKVLDEGIDRTSNPSPLFGLKGDILLRLGRQKEAFSEYEKLQKVDWKAGNSKILQGLLFIRKPERAIEKLKKEIRQNPDDKELMSDLSRLYMAVGKMQEAIGTAEEMIAKFPRSSSGYVTLAGLYQKKENYPKALEILSNASCEKDAVYHIALGTALAINEKNDLALAEFKRAQRMNPRNVAAMFQEAITLHSLGRINEAISKYEDVLGLSRNFIPALNNLAYLYADSKNDITKALRLATRAYVLSPNDGNIQDTLGYVLLKRGDTSQAIKVLQAALKSLPGNPTVHYHLALAYSAAEQQKLAIETLEKALNLGDFPEERDAKGLMDDLRRNSKT